MLSQSQFQKSALIGMEEFCLKKSIFSVDFFLAPSIYEYSELTQVYHQQLGKCNNISKLTYFRQVYGSLQIYMTIFLRFKGILVIPRAL